MDIVERLRQEIGGYTDKDIERAEVNMQEAADEIERLQEENQRQKEKIMLLNSMVQTEHEIIRVATRKEGK